MRTPARQVIETFIRLRRPIHPAALADLGGISMRAARGLLARLAGARVLHDDKTGGFGPGDEAATWLASEPRTRPGGASKRYLIEKQRRELANQLHPRKSRDSMLRRLRGGASQCSLEPR
jgi:hypothetical protein